MEQVAEIFKMLMNHMSPADWAEMIERIEAQTKANDQFVLNYEIEAVLNAIISIYG